MRKIKVSRCRIQYPYIESIRDYTRLSDFSRAGFRIEDVCRNFKNEATWYRALWHLRCRIRYNPESNQRAVAWKTLYTFPTRTAISTCSTWNAMMMACGSTATTAIPTISGTTTTALCSSGANHFISLLRHYLGGEFCF